PSKLLPFRQEVPFLIENLNAVVATIANEDPSLGIHCDGVWSVKLTGSAAFFAPGLNELSFVGEFHDAGIAVAAMPVSHEDISVGSDDHVRRLIESIGTVSGNSGLAQGQQYLAFRAELDDLMPLTISSLRIGDPNVSLLLHEDTVREDEQTLTETLQ